MDLNQALFEELSPQSVYPQFRAPKKFKPEEIEQAELRNLAIMALYSAVIADTALGRNFPFKENSEGVVSDWIRGLRKSFKAKTHSRFVFYKNYSANPLEQVFGKLLNSNDVLKQEKALKAAVTWLAQQGKCLNPGLFPDIFLIDSKDEPKNTFKVVLARHLMATTQTFDSSRIKEAPVEAFYLVKWTKNVADKAGLKLDDEALVEQVALALDQAPEFYGSFGF